MLLCAGCGCLLLLLSAVCNTAGFAPLVMFTRADELCAQLSRSDCENGLHSCVLAAHRSMKHCRKQAFTIQHFLWVENFPHRSLSSHNKKQVLGSWLHTWKHLATLQALSCIVDQAGVVNDPVDVKGGTSATGIVKSNGDTAADMETPVKKSFYQRMAPGLAVAANVAAPIAALALPPPIGPAVCGALACAGAYASSSARRAAANLLQQKQQQQQPQESSECSEEEPEQER